MHSVLWQEWVSEGGSCPSPLTRGPLRGNTCSVGPGSRLVSDLSSVSIPFQASGTLSCLSGPLCLLGCPSASVDSSCCDSVSLFCPVCVSGLYSSASLLPIDGNLPPETLVTPALSSCLRISRSPRLYGLPHRPPAWHTTGPHSRVPLSTLMPRARALFSLWTALKVPGAAGQGWRRTWGRPALAAPSWTLTSWSLLGISKA